MAFDALFLSAMRQELCRVLIGARIDRVQQPERHCVVLQVRSREFNGRLLISASPNTPRLQLTRLPFENPQQPPMFCMLLRKHLVGGRIAALTQPPLERLLDLTLECTDELGVPCRKHLIAELMGRGANLILTGEDGRIIDCLRRVDADASSARPVLPGLFYRLPPLQEKTDPLTADARTVEALLRSVGHSVPLDRWFLDTFGGLSPLTCRELAFLAAGDPERDICSMTEGEKLACAERAAAEFSAMAAGSFIPVLLSENGRPREFSCRPIRQYGNYLEQRTCADFSELLDAYYGLRDRADRLRQRTQTLHKTVNTCLQRVRRRVENQRKELANAADREPLRQAGDIVTANLHRIRRGQTVLTAENFYDPELREIRIALSPTLSPQQNAARYYRDYARAKTAEKVLTEQIAAGETEQAYLETVLEALSRAESDRDVSEIRRELVEGAYLRAGEKRQMKQPPGQPMEFCSGEGFPILVGKNNRQNEQLTFKTAEKNDLWFHVQKRPGSHVILRCGGELPGDDAVTEAATLAALYSGASESRNVPVDVTQARWVKKQPGGKPGMVIYKNYRTVFVTPDPALAERLRTK